MNLVHSRLHCFFGALPFVAPTKGSSSAVGFALGFRGFGFPNGG